VRKQTPGSAASKMANSLLFCRWRILKWPQVGETWLQFGWMHLNF